MSQDEFDAPAADLTDTFHAIQQSLTAGNDALDHLQSTLDATVDSGKSHIDNLHTSVVAKVNQLENKTQALTDELDAATHQMHDIRHKCVAELDNLTISLTSLDKKIHEFVEACRGSLSQALGDLDSLDSLIDAQKVQTELRFNQWVGLVPGAQESMTTTQSSYQHALSTLLDGAHDTYRQLAEHATQLSRDAGDQLHALTASFDTSAATLTASTESGLGDALSRVQQNADAAERALDGAVGDLIKACEKISDKASKVLDFLAKVADLLRAIKPVTDTLSAVT